MDSYIYLPAMISAVIIALVISMKFDLEMGFGALIGIIAFAVLGGLTYGGIEIKTKYYSEPLTAKDIKSLGQCEREAALRQFETLKRPIIRGDISDFERVCEESAKRADQEDNKEKILIEQKSALYK